jgi:hypothetical protein
MANAHAACEWFVKGAPVRGHDALTNGPVDAFKTMREEVR